MRTLVIHPADRSTDCLTPIYEGKGFDVLRGRASYDPPIASLIPDYDRVIMLGHGSPDGLFSVGQFPGSYVIDHSHAPLLEGKSNVYVWCHASDYVKQHGLKGFTSGMFISEVAEGHWFRINASQKSVTESNDRFARLLGQFLDEPWQVIDQYIDASELVRFNNSRLEYIT